MISCTVYATQWNVSGIPVLKKRLCGCVFVKGSCLLTHRLVRGQPLLIIFVLSILLDRQNFMPETEELHRKHQQEDNESLDEMMAHKTRVNEQRAHIIEEKKKSKDSVES